MEIVVFSTSDKFHSEINDVIQLFKSGLTSFHLKKNKFSKEELSEYIELIPQKYHDRIILHTHHKLAKKFKIKGIHLSSVHRKKKHSSNFKLNLLRIKHPAWTLSRTSNKSHLLPEISKRYDYILLSPVYETISQKSHSGHFSFKTLQTILKNCSVPIYAFGGVDIDKIDELHQCGFNGVAVLGAIWHNTHPPVEAFIALKNKIESL